MPLPALLASTLIISIGTTARAHGDARLPSGVYHGCGSVICASFCASENGYSGPLPSSCVTVTARRRRQVPDLELIDDEQLAGVDPGGDDGPRARSRRWSGPTDAVPVSTGRPSVVRASIAAALTPVVVSDAWTSSPATTMSRKWALMQPCSNQAWPHTATAQRIELAEVRGPFDRGTSEPEGRRGGAVMDARMAVIGLVGQHLGR